MEPFDDAVFASSSTCAWRRSRRGDAIVRDIEATQRELLANFLGFRSSPSCRSSPRSCSATLGEASSRPRRRRRSSSSRRSEPEGEAAPPGLLRRLHGEADHPRGRRRRPTDGEIVSLCSEFLGAAPTPRPPPLRGILANWSRTRDADKAGARCPGVVGGARLRVREEDLRGCLISRAWSLRRPAPPPAGPLVLPHAVHETRRWAGYRVPPGARPPTSAVGDIGMDEEGRTDLTGSKEIKMMPFGAGRRVCPGMAMALLHLEYFVANLVREFEWRGADNEEVDLTEKLEFTVVMKRPLRARAVPLRSPPPAVAAA
ncbi:unnamed protein product [Miscanthus lutarioriparius]|uniref:Cytochrome P450 n=1 Tax=Miscanthus lutarioriparius TaxID=422564 RepID=A0A811N3Q5_9POAL|nr:unnamed protein product [Miscanthus lutarioriparius]